MLGLSKNASEDAIKEAYRKKAKLFHPDMNSNPDASDIFIEITEAYQYLLARKSLEKKLKEELVNNAHFDKKWEQEKRRKAKAYAQRHAQMKYDAFEQSWLYKSAMIFANFFDYIIFFTGIFSIISAIIGAILTYKADEFTIDTILVTFFGIVIGASFIVTTFRKFKIFSS
jgi:curved DNA-binding protein CbpA